MSAKMAQAPARAGVARYDNRQQNDQAGGQPQAINRRR